MTQIAQRPVQEDAGLPSVPPAHPHYTLATLVTLGIVGTLVAVGIAIAALMITAGRNSVDDSIVAERVEEALTGAVLPTGTDADVVGAFTPKAQLPLAPDSEINVATAPAVPPPSGRITPAIVEVSFEISEGVNTIDPETGNMFETWGYKVLGEPDAGVVVGTPGPMIRARVGDVLRFTITNPATNTHPHNVDFHAVTGQGGGAEATTVAPGETKTIEARLLYPGFFMYHCAYGDVPTHISHGMFGGILVDPETPLPEVDHEWYVVQSEYYTTGSGQVTLDREALTAEHPSHVVFNGARGALAGDNSLHMAVGDRARIYFVNAGLNLGSNFHPIGSHWDKVYQEAAFLGAPLRGSQTTLVPAGGGTVVELVGQVPSTLILVDHALTRAFDKGAIGLIVVSGPENHEIFEEIAPVDEGPTATTAVVGPSETVFIVAGAFDAQPMDATDEFAEGEDPTDYSPNVLTVPVGTTVTWTNEDSTMHTVTAVDGSFDSGFFDNGDSWSYTFDQPGEYEYFCLPHPWMRGKVIVEA